MRRLFGLFALALGATPALAEAPPVAPYAVDLINTHGLISCDSPLQLDTFAIAQKERPEEAYRVLQELPGAPTEIIKDGEASVAEPCSEVPYLNNVQVTAREPLPDITDSGYVLKRWRLTVEEESNHELTVLWMEWQCDPVEVCEGLVAKYIPLDEAL
jgi:hypothetical protein